MVAGGRRQFFTPTGDIKMSQKSFSLKFSDVPFPTLDANMTSET